MKKTMGLKLPNSSERFKFWEDRLVETTVARDLALARLALCMNSDQLRLFDRDQLIVEAQSQFQLFLPMESPLHTRNQHSQE